MLQAGVQGVADVAETVQTLTGPVLDTVSHSTSRLFGTGGSTNGNRDGASATVRWQSGRRVHMDLDPLLPFPRWHEHAAVVEEPVRQIAGGVQRSRRGRTGPAGGRTRRQRRSATRCWSRCAPWSTPPPPTWPPRDPIRRAASRRSPTRVTRWRSWCRSPRRPSTCSRSAPRSPAGWSGCPPRRRPPERPRPCSTDQPRVVAVLESRLGRVGTDLALAASTAAANGLTQAVGTPLLNLVAAGPADQRGRRPSPPLA